MKNAQRRQPNPDRIPQCLSGGPSRFPLDSAAVWTLGRLLPDPSIRFAAAAVTMAFCVAGCARDDAGALSVVVSLPEQQVMNAAKATILVDYSGTGANVLSEAGGPACAFILPGIDGDFSDDRKGTLTIRSSGPRALRGPADIVACRMKGAENATAAEVRAKLVVRVSAAEDAAGKPIDLTAKPVHHASANGPRSEGAVEAAQAEAVKAAAATAAAAPPGLDAEATAPAGTAATPGGLAAGAGLAGKAAASGGPGAMGAASRPPAPNSPRPSPAPVTATPRGSSSPGASDPPPVDNSAVPPADRDPGYDDRDADNPSVPAYNLEISVGSSGMISALQFDIVHLGKSGGFIGRGENITYTALVSAIVAGNYRGERDASIGMINLQGFPTPGPIMTCAFRTRESLSANSFQITVTDASGPDGEPIDPQPSVSITSISRR